MSIKSVYLSRNRLEELRDGLFSVNEELFGTLDNYLKCNSNDDKGEYLVNIFDGHELYELSVVDRHYNLFSDVDTILKANGGD